VLGAQPAAASGGIEILPDWTGLLPILIGLFAALIFPVHALIFRPLFRVLDEREERIDGARARAQQVDEEAGAVLARYEDALVQAREEASAQRKTALARARVEEKDATGEARGVAEQELARARGEIAASLAEARESLRPRAEELAREAAERILGRNLS
jgi:F-type H+-transporting ATPase subunit b